MAGTAKPAYGTPNWEMIQRWFALDPADDGPFWALNLMKYHEVAQYSDPSAPAVSGKSADDAYAPRGPLAAVGARIAFFGDVLDQHGGTPAWDRIAIVRYPTRAAFFEMQQRDDFKDQHVHKEAGMEFTIVMSCLPRAAGPATDTEPDSWVLTVERGADLHCGPLPDGVSLVADFDVEGVIVGDERSFDRAQFLRADSDTAIAAIADLCGQAEDACVIVVDRAMDHLVESIESAHTDTTPRG